MCRLTSWYYSQYFVLGVVLRMVRSDLLEDPSLGSLTNIQIKESPEDECMMKVDRHFPGLLHDDYVLSVMRRIRRNDTELPVKHKRSKRSVKMAAAIGPLIDKVFDLYKKGLQKRKQHRKNLKKNEERIYYYLMPYSRKIPYQFYNVTENIFGSVHMMVMLRKSIRESFRERFVRGRSRHYGISNRDIPRMDSYQSYVRADDAFRAAARTFYKAIFIRRRALRYLHKFRRFRKDLARKNYSAKLVDLERRSIKAMVTAWRSRLLNYYVRRDYRILKELVESIKKQLNGYRKRVENGKEFATFRARRSLRQWDQKVHVLLKVVKQQKYNMKRLLVAALQSLSSLRTLAADAKRHASDLYRNNNDLQILRLLTNRKVPKNINRYIKETSYIPKNISVAKYMIHSAKLSLPSSWLTWLCPPPPTDAPVTHGPPAEETRSDHVILLDAPDQEDIYFATEEKAVLNTEYTAVNEGSGSEEGAADFFHNLYFNNISNIEEAYTGILVPVTPAATMTTTPHTHVMREDDEGSGDVVSSGDGSGIREIPDDRPPMCRKPSISIDTVAHLIYKWRRKILMQRHYQQGRLHTGRYSRRVRGLQLRYPYAKTKLDSASKTTPILTEMVMIRANQTDELVVLQKATDSGNQARNILHKIEAFPVIHPVPDIKHHRMLLEEAASKIPNINMNVQNIEENTSKLVKLLNSVDVGSLVHKVVQNTENTAKFQNDVTSAISTLRMNIRKAYGQLASIKRSAVIDSEKTISLSPWFLTQANSAVSSVAVDVRTNSSQGTILRLKNTPHQWSTSSYHLTLFLKNSKPSVHWRHQRTYQYLTTDREINDGTWHRLRIDRIGSTLKLSEHPVQDSSTTMSKSETLHYTSVQALPPYIQLGQFDYHKDSITGCVMEFTVNSFLLPLPEVGTPWTYCPDEKPEVTYTGSGELDELLTTTQPEGFECLGYTDETIPYEFRLDSDELTSFSFSFKSDTDRTVLMSYFPAKNHYLLVYMYGGRLWVNGRTSAGYFRNFCRKHNARPMKWHTIKFQKLNYWVEFHLDGHKCDYITGNAIDTRDSSSSLLVLGSVGSDKSSPISSIKWLRPFKGWIKQFIQNDQIMLFNNNQWARGCPIM